MQVRLHGRDGDEAIGFFHRDLGLWLGLVCAPGGFAFLQGAAAADGDNHAPPVVAASEVHRRGFDHDNRHLHSDALPRVLGHGQLDVANREQADIDEVLAGAIARVGESHFVTAGGVMARIPDVVEDAIGLDGDLNAVAELGGRDLSDVAVHECVGGDAGDGGDSRDAQNEPSELARVANH